MRRPQNAAQKALPFRDKVLKFPVQLLNSLANDIDLDPQDDQ